MRRACKVTLKFTNARKRKAIAALLYRYRAAVNFYIKSLWKQAGGLNAETLARLQTTKLSARYRSQALKQALDVVIATKRAAKAQKIRAGRPVFRGSAILDAKFVSVEEGRGSFDLVIRLSSLVPGKKITIPTKRTAVLNKWLSRQGAKLVQGCALSENGIVLWVELPAPVRKTKGKTLGVDIGMNKLLSDSAGKHYGQDVKDILAKIRRRKPGSKGKQRAFRERENHINRIVNQLPWKSLAVVGVEKLHDMKRGKSRKRGKSFRKAVAPWLYRRVLDRISCKAEERDVLVIQNDPAYTSQDCPKCGRRDSLNRRGEKFLCVDCRHAGDADHVGAQNILARTLTTLGSVESPRLKKR